MKITACTQENHIRMSLSNYLSSPSLGVVESIKEFKRVISSCKTAKEACSALNSHKDTVKKFTAYKDLENGYILKAVDYMGNVDLIKVVEL